MDKRSSKKDKEAQLEEALEETFPASDPMSISQPTGTSPDRPLHRKPAQIDKRLVHELAQSVKHHLEQKKR